MLAAAISGAATGGGDELRKAVTLYASFDDAVQADFAVGRREMGTRSGAPKSASEGGAIGGVRPASAAF